MDYKNKKSGVIYHVTNESLTEMYESSEDFEKVEAKAKAEKAKATK